MRPTHAAAVGLFVSALCADAHAVQIKSGDIVTPQFDNIGTVLVVDSATGDRGVFSRSPDVGSGPMMSRPTSIVRLPGGDFLVADTLRHAAITRIDGVSGDRVDIARLDLGVGPLHDVVSVLLTSSGKTILVNGGESSGFITELDLATGNRTLISGFGIGDGPAFDRLAGGALDADGYLIVGEFFQKAVFKVDLATGSRTILSGIGIGSGPELGGVTDLVVMPNGSIVAVSIILGETEPGVASLIRIDPTNGNRSIIKTGPDLDFGYSRIALGSNGQILGAMAGAHDAIYSINPQSGVRTLISGKGLGSGPNLFWGDLVVAPEPSSLVLCAFGVLTLTWRLRRRLPAGRVVG